MVSAAELQALLERVGELDPEESTEPRRAIQLRLVEPLLELLEWDVRSEDVEPAADLEGWRVDYLLSTGDVPTVAVGVLSPDTDISSSPPDRIRDALSTAPVDSALLTNGRSFLLLAREGDTWYDRSVDLEELPAASEALSHYAEPAVRDRLEARGLDRAEATRRLGERRDEAIDAVTEAVVDVAGETLRADARAAAVTLVDDLAGGEASGVEHAEPTSAAEDTPLGSGADTGSSERNAGDDGDAHRDSDGFDSGSTSVESTSAPERAEIDSGPDSRERGASRDSRGGEGETGPGERASAEPHPSTNDPVQSGESGEYVVRFFGGTSSVGAVGTETPGATLAGAVRFLSENHGLASSITLPWGVDSDRALLARSPEHPDGRPMEPHREVAGGVVVWTGAPEDDARRGIEQLAEAAGLRAMFQGDW